MHKKIIRKIYKVIISIFSIETQARLVGVNIGENNFIASKFWGSEPYLISIGSNCQITDGVKIFTHGGGNAIRKRILNLIVLGRLTSEIMST